MSETESKSDAETNEECPTCGNTAVKAVLDKRIELGDTKGGNKFRRRCMTCSAWLSMSSAEYFESHDDPFVLPLGGDPNGDFDELVPLDEFNEFICPDDGCDRRHTGFPENCGCGAIYEW